jgi:histidyl-tRNA synthetase
MLTESFVSMMATSSTVQRPKGTQDILPAQSHQWFGLLATAATVLESANYQRIDTPIFEATHLFERGVGDSTDIVNKEMYSFEKEGRSITLRPEGTAGVVRAFIEQGLHRAAKPVRLYYAGPMFRYERPQEGRQRQFHQFGCELLGLDTPQADAEAILQAMTVLEALEVQGVELHLNTVGTPEDRVRFRDALKTVLAPHLPTLCEDCQRRFEQNPIRMLDCKVSTCKTLYNSEVVESFLQTFDWSVQAQESFKTLCDILTTLNIHYTINRRMVRGLDYYTGTVFELTSNQLGAQSAVCGGGRYNRLVETLGGPETPAIGWAMGVERLMKLATLHHAPVLDYYVVTNRPAAAFALAKQLRTLGKRVEVDLTNKPFGKQLAQADKRNAVHAIILGDTEVAAEQVQVKTFATGEQVAYQQTSFLGTLRI